jgi:murein DD-endopeptidase MepM/ murein hydrolase activator NlpD
MEIKLSFFNNIISKIANAMIIRPRFTGLIMLLFICFTIVGWGFAIHYHRIAELLLIPNEAAAENATISASLPSPQSPQQWQSVTIQSGDSLYTIFKQLNFSMKDLAKITSAAKANHHSLTRLKPGDQIRFLLTPQQHLQEMVFSIDPTTDLVITRTDTGFSVASQPDQTVQATQSSTVPTPTTKQSSTSTPPQPTAALPTPPEAAQNYQTHLAQSIHEQTQNLIKYGFATVGKSLYETGRSAGLSPKAARLLVYLFTENSTVAKNIQRGDQLSVLTDKDGLLLIELSNKKKEKDIKLVRFTAPDGHTDYYTDKGENLKPPILRAPLHYERISSFFSIHRWQPILHIMRPHYGVDYAAVTGTPIKAAGNGKLVFMGQERGYGNMIEIKHPGNYETVYAHISRFAKGVHQGSYVKQGQVIAYVGDTGLSTGSHLHFEIRLNNIPRNPLTVPLPVGTEIAQAYRSKFLAEAKELSTVLAENQQNTATKLASNQH